MTHFSLTSRERTIVLASIIMTGLFLLAYIVIGKAAHPLRDIASDSYAPLASALYEHGTFTLSTSSPYRLEATHVPGYPLFLALFAGPVGSVIPALVLQMLLFALSGVLLYRLFEGVFSERVRFIGALLYVVEPYTAFTVAQPLSEALFLFLFLSGLVVGRRALEQKRTPLFFWSGMVLGAAVLTRPILLYLLPLLVIVVTYTVYRHSPHQALRVCGAGVLGILLVLMPWAYRNHEAFGVWALSTKGAYTLYFYDAAQVLQYRDGLSATDVNAELLKRVQTVYPEVRTTDDLRSPRYAASMEKESLSIIRSAPSTFVKLYAASLATFFFSDGYRLLWYEFSGSATPLPNVTKAVTTGHLEILIPYVEEHGVQALFFILGLLFWGSMMFLAGVTVVRAFRNTRIRSAVFACVVALAYFAIITGPVAQARYRIVATPFLFVLAAAGASILRRSMARRTTYES